MFRLGVVKDPMLAHQNYQGMLAIPYLDQHGKTLAVRFRCIEDHDHRAHYHGKYNSVADSNSRLYNISAIHKPGSVIHLTEGEMDAIILNQEGFPAVAAPGAESWESRHTVMLSGFEKVYVWADPDTAGAKFARTVERNLNEAAVILELKTGDVNELYLEGGYDALDTVLRRGNSQ